MWFSGLGDIARIGISGVVAFVALLASIRLAGNRTLSSMNASDFIVTVAMGTTFATGVAILCGIGFTMSLFIASLGFAEGPLLNDAKVGILVASLISGVSGALLLARDGTTHKLSES